MGALWWYLVPLLATAGAPEVARPRGVPLARASLYAPGETFTCLDGSLTVPYSYVNDDYCDCRDGTDEPGTSACLNGVFHCANAGHEPLDLPSSRVNDGVCDCCDAADEYAGGECRDTCADLGREARQRAQRRAELLQAGAKLRAEVVRAGARLRTEMNERLRELEKDRAEAELLKEEKEKFKADAELLENAALEQYRAVEDAERREREKEEAHANRKEAEETFFKFDSNGDGFVDVSEIKSRATFDKNRDGEVSEEEASLFLGENGQLGLEEFIEIAWPLVKPYMMVEGGLFKPPERNEEIDDEIERHEDEEEEEEEEDREHDHEEVEGGEDDGGEEPEAETEAPAEPDSRYDEETRRLVDAATEARGDLTRAEKAVREIDSEIEKIRGALDKDYGPQEEFATLAGKCLEFTDREYLYKLCPFDRATQQPKSGGGSETNLGSWGEWVGPGEDKYSAMLYSRGLSCWNGPDRSARIEVRCGLEDAITSVSEPNRCEYVFEMETPAACVDSEPDAGQTSHDEL